jgi:hypothetical protein
VSAPDYFQELVDDARDVQADRKDRWTYERWLKARQEFAEQESEEAPREEDLKRAWEHAKPKRKKYARAPDNLQWRKHPEYPIEISSYANARWLEDGRGHRAGDWLDLYPDGYGVLFFRVWDSLRKRSVWLSPSRALIASGWIQAPKYHRKKMATA